MIYVILIVIFSLSFLFGKYYFGKVFNPVSIYTTIWIGMLAFFHLKLIKYDDLSFYAWILILFSFIAFLLGVLVFFTADKVFQRNTMNTREPANKLSDFLYNNRIKLKLIIVFFSVVGFIGAIQHWSILLSKYGSIVEVFLHLGRIRQLTVQGEIEGILPYISSFSFVAIFFAGVYSALKQRITLISFLPMIAIILKDTAAAGRVSILISFLQFGITYIFTSYFLKSEKDYVKSKTKYVNIIAFLFIILIFFSSIFFIKGLRGGSEQLQGAGRGISNFSDNVFITPTLYLYFSGHVGVLSKYLEKSEEEARFGENTFRFVYNVLNKVGFTDEAEMYQRAYFIPVWINTGTFLRELHADFGVGGTLLFLFFLGLIISYFWQKFYTDGNIFHLVFLVYLNLILALSFLMMITRITTWSIGLITILFIISALKKSTSLNAEVNK